jgi:hypothetical protein
MFRWPNQESESLSVLKGLLVWVQTLEPGNVAQINRILYLDYIGDLRKFIILAYPGIVYIDVYWVYSILALFDCKKNITDGQICWILIISSPSSCGSSRFCSAVSIDRILHHQQRATDGYGFKLLTPENNIRFKSNIAIRDQFCGFVGTPRTPMHCQC